MSGGVFGRGRRALGVSILLTTGLVAFEGLSVTAALPEIGADLGSVRLLPWVITSYLLASGVAIAMAGPLIDALGPRLVFRAATLAFLLTSLACGLCHDMGLLIAARIAQGLAGGLVMSTSGSAIGLGYPERLRSRAYAMASTAWGVLAFGGPALAAALLTALDWRWIFLANVPLALIAAVAGWNAVPGPPEGRSPVVIDVRGALLVVTFVSLGLVATSQLNQVGAAAAVLGSIVGWLYWRHSGSTEAPVLERRYFARAPFVSLSCSAALIMSSGIGVETYLPLYLRGARGVSVSLAAWSVLFLTVGWTLAANIASRLYDRIDEWRMVVVGGMLMVPGLILSAAAIWWEWPLWTLFALYTVLGLGIGATTNACLTLVQACAEPREIGRATTAHQFFRTMSVTYGAALAGAVMLGYAALQGSDAEALRSLLVSTADSQTATVADPSAPATLAAGFAVAHLLGIVLAVAGLVVASRMARARGARLHPVVEKA